MRITEEWLAERCHDDGGCQVWDRRVDRHGAPVATTPMVDGQRNLFRVRRSVWELRKGPIPDGLYVVNFCGNSRCVRCLQVATFSDVNSQTWARPDTRARRIKAMKQGARASRGKLDMDKARYIRGTNKTLEQVAEELGISIQLASTVRRGLTWQEECNPFAGLGGRA
jgi:hypothetical protein